MLVCLFIFKNYLKLLNLIQTHICEHILWSMSFIVHGLYKLNMYYFFIFLLNVVIFKLRALQHLFIIVIM